MTRLTDWPERLDAAIEVARHRPFAWGRQDCVTFAAACIEAVTGVDPIAGLPRWYDRDEAVATIRHASGGRRSLAAAIDRIMTAFGWEGIDPAFLSRGDLCLASGRRGRFATICTGPRLAAPGPSGLAFFPLSLACASRVRAAWRIG